MTDQSIIYDKKDFIAYVTLNRPEKLNAFDDQMMEDLDVIWKDVMKDDNVRVVVLTGTGKGFCSGHDMSTKVPEGGPAPFKAGFMPFPDPWQYDMPAEAFDKPIVAAVNGICAGGGFLLLSGCDIIICSENAQFLEPHVTRGRVPFFETMFTISRTNYGAGMRMALMGAAERVSAQRAYELGLVTEVLSQDKLLTRATEIAQAISQQAPIAVRATKRAMARAFKPLQQDARALHHKYAESIAWGTRDGREGQSAFAEKRKPQWAGK